jgi:CRISPR-associated protein Cas2
MARRQRLNVLTGWSMMWIVCMFDIPVGTKIEQRKATRFRNTLLNNGFTMKQFSVYIKPCRDLSVAKNRAKSLKWAIPENSSVSFLYITDKQYVTSDTFLGKNSVNNEEQTREKNGQLLLFE